MTETKEETDSLDNRRVRNEKFLKRGLCISAALLFGWWVLMAALDIFNLPFCRNAIFERFAIVVVLVFFATTILFSLARVVHALLGLQVRLSEFVLTFLVTGGFMTVCMSFFIPRDAIRGVAEIVPYLFFMLAIFSGTFVGSMWGWYAAKRLREEDNGRRIFLMCKGWLLVVGFAGGVIFALWTIILALMYIARTDAFMWGPYYHYWYGGFGFSMFAAVPALMTERHIRRMIREEQVCVLPDDAHN
jgi:hypothetical protein